MKLLFISPERERRKDEPFLFKFSFFNLPYVASVTPSDIEIKIIDEAFEKINFNEKIDLVGLTAQTLAVPRAYQICMEFKKRGVPAMIKNLYTMGKGFNQPSRYGKAARRIHFSIWL